jgi:signal transduction histidine kinase
MTDQLGTEQTAASQGTDRLLAYVADLELEVDRLRHQGMFIERQAGPMLLEILSLCTASDSNGNALSSVESIARELRSILKDLHDSPGYHPAHDQVVAIAVRPLAEQVFRWQQRLTGAVGASLQLRLDTDHVEWFPARLRHILDNLFANALRHRDPTIEDQWVSLGLRRTGVEYEISVSDNGVGPPPGADRRALELFYRAGPIRSAGFGAGLSVVRLLVEQSGGTLTASQRGDRGTDFVLTLPRYDLLDYLE